jgi:VWFA-related protein
MHLLNRRSFLGALGGAGTLAAQQDDILFRSDTRLVQLHATVVNSKGQLVTDLPRTAFKVFENNVEQPIKLFKREDVPVSLGLIVDNSGSMRDRRQKVEAAAIQMVKASNQLDQVFIVNFNEEAYLDCDFTSNIKEMEERGLTRIDSRGGTAFYDALGMSIDHVKRGKRDKKVLMLITDGADNASTLTLEKLLAKIHAAEGLVVHAIGLLATEAPREARKAKRAVEEITKAGGGLCFLPKELEEVDKFALQVAHDIRNQYAIGYSPTNQAMDGSFRQVRVVANGPNKPLVRTRSGYYATPDQREPKAVTSARP